MTAPRVMKATARTWDAIVIGSGMSGGWAAKELCERGLRTLVLDAGKPFDPQTSTVEHVPPWEMPFRGLGDRRDIEARQPVQRQSVLFDEMSRRFWADDTQHPYTTADGRPFNYFRPSHVGGKSNVWGRQVYRLSDVDFTANARDGVGVDWPIRYADLAPWYAHVERFIGVSGQAEGMAHVPDGVFLPPMKLNPVERHLRARVREAYGGERLVTIGRVAVLTRAQHGRGACHYCGPCSRGCVTRSYFSSPNATLPAARATGRLTLRPRSVVRELVWDGASRRVTGVRAIDADTREELEFQARVVFLCAGTFESARLLLLSKSSDFPDGLANGSGQVGRNVMDHIKGAGASGRFDGWEDVAPIGARPNGIYVPPFRNVRDRHPDFPRAYAFQGGAGRQGWRDRLGSPGIGASFKRELEQPGPWTFGWEARGEMLPRESNRMTLHPTAVDAWGIPVAHFDVQWSDAELAMHRDMVRTAGEMLEAAGARDVRTFERVSVPGATNHEMGTARMGRDARTSVLDGFARAHEVPNLFVPDGSCMTSSPCQNPSLTYMAITARAVDHAARLLARREL
jgi:choline dehydrogenase-like flavoprotein